MLNKLKRLGDLKRLRDQAQLVKKKLADIQIEVDQNGIFIVMRADQKVEKVTVDGKEETRIKEAVNEAIRRSQEAAARELQEMTRGMF